MVHGQRSIYRDHRGGSIDRTGVVGTASTTATAAGHKEDDRQKRMNQERRFGQHDYSRELKLETGGT